MNSNYKNIHISNKFCEVVFSPNIENPFFQILVHIPKILHVNIEEDPVEIKKMYWNHVLVKLGERKNGQVQATLKTSTQYMCAIFMHMHMQNSLVSKSGRFLEL
jgi:hypothetical protein